MRVASGPAIAPRIQRAAGPRARRGIERSARYRYRVPRQGHVRSRAVKQRSRVNYARTRAWAALFRGRAVPGDFNSSAVPRGLRDTEFRWGIEPCCPSRTSPRCGSKVAARLVPTTPTRDSVPARPSRRPRLSVDYYRVRIRAGCRCLVINGKIAIPASRAGSPPSFFLRAPHRSAETRACSASRA